MPTRNILTLRERRVLSNMLSTYRAVLATYLATTTPEHRNPVDDVGEIIAVLEQVIDSATLPYEEWSTKYLAADAAKWNGEITDAQV